MHLIGVRIYECPGIPLYSACSESFRPFSLYRATNVVENESDPCGKVDTNSMIIPSDNINCFFFFLPWRLQLLPTPPSFVISVTAKRKFVAPDVEYLNRHTFSVHYKDVEGVKCLIVTALRSSFLSTNDSFGSNGSFTVNNKTHGGIVT